MITPNTALRRTPAAAPLSPVSFQAFGEPPEEGVARRLGLPVATEPYVVISDSGTEELRSLGGRGPTTVGYGTGNSLTLNCELEAAK
jgi:hypothetical protein